MSKLRAMIEALAGMTLITLYLGFYVALGICLYILAHYAIWEIVNA